MPFDSLGLITMIHCVVLPNFEKALPDGVPECHKMSDGVVGLRFDSE